MTALRLRFLLPLSILCLQMTAQVEDLMRDKNITWIAESYNDFLTDASAEEKIGKRISGVRLLKFYNPNGEDMPEEFVLQNFILELAKTDKLAIYKDDKCTQPTTYGKASGSVDTIDLEDVTTYETKTCTMGKGWIRDEQILFFRAHQILYYDSSKVQFGLRTLSIAPMMKQTDEAGVIVAWKPLFWMKVTDLVEKRHLSDESIIWAKRMSLFNGVPFNADSVKILKKTDDNMPISHLCQAVLTNPQIPFYETNSIEIKTQCTKVERMEIFIQRDTVVSIEPIHYEAEKNKVNIREIKVADMKELKLIQNWYWDDKKKQFQIWLLATGPLIDVTNFEGEFLFKRPLFYRRTDD
jgi:hypothetical protein